MDKFRFLSFSLSLSIIQFYMWNDITFPCCKHFLIPAGHNLCSNSVHLYLQWLPCLLSVNENQLDVKEWENELCVGATFLWVAMNSKIVSNIWACCDFPKILQQLRLLRANSQATTTSTHKYIYTHTQNSSGLLAFAHFTARFNDDPKIIHNVFYNFNFISSTII